MPVTASWSALDVAQVRGHSRLITCKSIQPLKILNPAAPTGACHAVLSTYGGGMVAGDQIRLRLRVGANSRLFLGSQSSTKIFRSVDGAVAEQHVVGVVEENGLAVVFPDPVVMQADSRYRQLQHWHLHQNALLVVVDWFHSGRMDQGERFAFTSLHTELKVTIGERLVLLDRFTFAPQDHIATSPANFAAYQTMFSVYLVANPADPRFQQLGEVLMQQQLAGSAEPHFQLTGLDCVVSAVRARDEVWILRAAANSRMALQSLCDQLMQAFAKEELVGYNPMQRKY